MKIYYNSQGRDIQASLNENTCKNHNSLDVQSLCLQLSLKERMRQMQIESNKNIM